MNDRLCKNKIDENVNRNRKIAIEKKSALAGDFLAVPINRLRHKKKWTTFVGLKVR